MGVKCSRRRNLSLNVGPSISDIVAQYKAQNAPTSHIMRVALLRIKLVWPWADRFSVIFGLS